MDDGTLNAADRYSASQHFGVNGNMFNVKYDFPTTGGRGAKRSKDRNSDL